MEKIKVSDEVAKQAKIYQDVVNDCDSLAMGIAAKRRAASTALWDMLWGEYPEHTRKDATYNSEEKTITINTKSRIDEVEAMRELVKMVVEDELDERESVKKQKRI